MSGPMSNRQLFVAQLSLLICGPCYAGATSDSEISAAQEQDADGNGLTDEAISRELELFRGAEVSLRPTLKIADSLHPVRGSWMSVLIAARPRRDSHNGITVRGLSQPTFATKSAIRRRHQASLSNSGNRLP